MTACHRYGSSRSTQHWPKVMRHLTLPPLMSLEGLSDSEQAGRDTCPGTFRCKSHLMKCGEHPRTLLHSGTYIRVGYVYHVHTAYLPWRNDCRTLHLRMNTEDIGSLKSRNLTPADGRTRWHVLSEPTRNRPVEG